MIHLQVVALYRASWHGHLTTLHSASGHRDDAALDDTSGNWDNTGHFGIGGVGWVDGVAKDCLEEFEVCIYVCVMIVDRCGTQYWRGMEDLYFTSYESEGGKET